MNKQFEIFLTVVLPLFAIVSTILYVLDRLHLKKVRADLLLQCEGLKELETLTFKVHKIQKQCLEDSETDYQEERTTDVYTPAQLTLILNSESKDA